MNEHEEQGGGMVEDAKDAVAEKFDEAKDAVHDKVAEFKAKREQKKADEEEMQPHWSTMGTMYVGHGTNEVKFEDEGEESK